MVKLADKAHGELSSERIFRELFQGLRAGCVTEQYGRANHA